MPGMPRCSEPRPLSPEPAAIRQWCPTYQQATRSLIIEGGTYCAVCQPKGPYGPEYEDWDEED